MAKQKKAALTCAFMMVDGKKFGGCVTRKRDLKKIIPKSVKTKKSKTKFRR